MFTIFCFVVRYNLASLRCKIMHATFWFFISHLLDMTFFICWVHITYVSFLWKNKWSSTSFVLFFQILKSKCRIFTLITIHIYFMIFFSVFSISPIFDVFCVFYFCSTMFWSFFCLKGFIFLFWFQVLLVLLPCCFDFFGALQYGAMKISVITCFL